MKIEIDGQRFHTLDEGTEITNLKESTLKTYLNREKDTIPPVSIKIGKEVLLSEKFLSDILAKEEKRKSLIVEIEDLTFESQKKAAEYFKVPANQMSAYLKVRKLVLADIETRSEPQNSPVSVSKEEEVETPPRHPIRADKPKIKVVGYQPVTPAEQIPIPSAFPKKKEEQKSKLTVLVIGGEPFWTRWKAFLAKQNIELIGYESKYPKESAIATKVKKVDVVVACQNMIGHGTYSKTKTVCKKQGVQLELFTGFGNAVIKQAIDKALDNKKDNK